MAGFTTSDLVSEVKLVGNIPDATSSDDVNSNANILKLATAELRRRVMPLIMSAREEFYVVSKDFSVTAEQARYRIPSRGIGNALREIHLIDGENVKQLPIIPPERITTTGSGSVDGYYLEHNDIILYPTPNVTSGTLRVRYFLRPNRLIATTGCAQISNIDTLTNVVTVTNMPSTWAIGDYFDLISAESPYEQVAVDQVATDIVSNTITFSSLPTDLAVGDWVAPQYYTPIPNIVEDAEPFLTLLTARRVLMAQGDRAAAADLMTDISEAALSLMTLISPRNQGELQTIINNDWSI